MFGEEKIQLEENDLEYFNNRIMHHNCFFMSRSQLDKDAEENGPTIQEEF